MVLRALAVSFQVVVPILDQPGLAPLYLSDIELCTEATVRVPTVRAMMPPLARVPQVRHHCARPCCFGHSEIFHLIE